MTQYPTSYAEALTTLKGKAHKRINANTRLEHYRIAADKIVVILHNTPIVCFEPSGKISLNSGGWHTVTTKRRINQCLPEGYSIRQRNFKWDILGPNASAFEFVDGFSFNVEQGLGLNAKVNA